MMMDMGMGAPAVSIDRNSVPYTGRAVGHAANFLRPGFGFQNPGKIPKSSGEWRQHDVTTEEARTACDRVTTEHREREYHCDVLNCAPPNLREDMMAKAIVA